MRYRFEFRRYRLPFRFAIRTAHGPWDVREGVILRLTDAMEGGGGAVGFGEAAPIPWFGTETVDEVETECLAIGEWVGEERLQSVPPRLRCFRNAIRAARSAIVSGIDQASPVKPAGPEYLAVAALLPAGREVLAQIPPKAEMGFRIFKWKVGVGDIADELALVDDVCAALPSGAKLRLDANGAWDRRAAERWLERCAAWPVEFMEQPVGASAPDGIPPRKEMDLLLGLAADYPTPIALDESLVADGDIERWLGAGWPGVFVVKPSLLADVPEAMARLRHAGADVVFSSALETAVGARVALQAAFSWQGEARAIGFGVWPLFADQRCDGPAAAPFIRRCDVGRINPETVWSALS
ncbi:MAG: o-succinylbenzoate synthase [Opitutus sp.]